jgi:curli biogenesis system outer membrane secretion channel CsgG
MKSLKIILACLAGGTAAFAGWETYKHVAGQLAGSAEQTHKRRVAVMDFSSEDGRTSRASAIVTERLTSEIASNPRVEVIERKKLDEVLKEQKLSSSGAVDPVTAREVGHLVGADAVVTGSVIDLDDKNVEVNARLVDTQSARIIKAVSTKVEKDWQEPKKQDGWGNFNFDMNINVDAPMALLPQGFMEDETCRKLDADEVGVVKMCVQLRAKKIAHDLKKGLLRLEDLKKNPGSEIKDPELKHLYYTKIKEWYYAKDLAPLTPQEEGVLAEGAALIEKYPCR